MQLESIAKTHQGLIRQMNQDSILVLGQHGVFMVADGMGGEKAGDEASQQIVRTISAAAESFFNQNPKSPEAVQTLLTDALRKANKDVHAIGAREPDKAGLGSTASLLCLHRGLYFIAQVGDSRIYRLRENAVKQLTRDHTLVWMLYEQGSISREQLETHPQRHLLTQCIGNENSVTADVFQGEALPGDVYLICSDGLTGYTSESQIFETLKNAEMTLEEKTDRLVQLALDGGGGDNVSVILVRVVSRDVNDDWQPPATAAPHASEANFDAETLVDEKARINGPPHSKKRGYLGIIVPLAVILLGLLLLPVMFGNDTARIYIPAGIDEDAVITVRRGTDREIKFIRGADTAGQYLEVDGRGEFYLRIQTPQYVDLMGMVVIDKDDDTGTLDQEPTPRAKLIVELQPEIEITDLVVEKLGGDQPREVAHYEKDRVMAESPRLEVYLDPGETHRLTVRAHGYPKPKEYTLSPLKQGEPRTIRVLFGLDRDAPQ